MITSYDKSGQRLFFQRETDYGGVYDPETALTPFTVIAADYPHWRRFDKIPEGVDVIVPLIEKIKQYDISDSKHASAIFSGNVEPAEFSIDVSAQALEFLVLSLTGNTTGNKPTLTSHKQAMTQIINTVAESGNIVQGDYFLIDLIYDTDDSLTHFAVWMDTVGNGSTGKPTITGIHADNVLAADISVSTPTNTATEIADAIETILETKADHVTSADNVAEVITVISKSAGAIQQARNGAASPEFTYSVTTWGSSDYAIPEALDTSTPSFTIHAEQRNATEAEDIVWDLFGCVIETVTVNVNYADKIVTATVDFKCPYALENTNGRCTNDPPKKYTNAFPTMSSLKEAASNYLIQEKTTDRTPETVDQVTLTITNNITFRSDLDKAYNILAVAGKRDVTLNIVGVTGEKELFTYWQEAYSYDATEVGWRPTSASTGLLNTKFKLQRDATYDYILISIRNWLLLEHNFHFMNVEEAVKSVDMTFEDGTADSNGRIIDDCDYVSYVDRSVIIV